MMRWQQENHMFARAKAHTKLVIVFSAAAMAAAALAVAPARRASAATNQFKA
jgi:hypothetical protein